MKKNHLLRIMVVLALAALSRPTLAVTTLTFEDFTNLQYVGDFFDGGTTLDGVQGPDLGITIDALALTINGNSFLTWDDFPEGPAIIRSEDGFENGVAISVASVPGSTVFVRVIAQGGGVLAEISQFVPSAFPDPLSFVEIGLEFDGIASGLEITDSELSGYNIAVNNITLGSATVVPVPAAGWLMLAAVATLWQRRKVAA